MAHPEWALSHKRKGTELRFIKGKYYLYEVSSKWDKERKVTRKITGKMIGRITEVDGFIPKGCKGKSETKNKKNISVKEYGASKMLLDVSNEVVDSLHKIFPKHAMTIFTLAQNRLMHRAPLKNMEFYYEESYISEVYPNIDLSKNVLTSFMNELGSQREEITAFLRDFTVGSEHIVFDTTHIISNSKNANINQYGYNPEHSFDPQLNLFYMFSVDKQMPVYYRIFPGNISGMSALRLCAKESGLKDCIAIGDKGFSCEKNITLLEETGLKFILPLRRDSSYINYDRLKSNDYNSAYDGHFFYKDRVVFYYEKIIDEKKKLTVFCDEKMKAEEKNTYLKCIEKNIEGYCIDKFSSKQTSFGTMSIVTNIKEMSAAKIYESYKSRMEIETLFDTYKNLLKADRTYMQTDNSFHSWAFINHIATMMYYKLFNILKEHNMLNKYSPEDLLLRLRNITKIKINNSWNLSEINSKSQKIFNSIGIHIT